jgi:hypothetical protein
MRGQTARQQFRWPVLLQNEPKSLRFIDENGGGPGVRLRKSGKEKPRKKG